jgi:hypothetical protein
MELMSIRTKSYDNLIDLIRQCKELKIDCTIGIQPDIQKRCQIYRDRIKNYYKNKISTSDAKKRNENRQKERIKARINFNIVTNNQWQRRCWIAIYNNKVDEIISLMDRGSNPNEQTPNHQTPLICLIRNDASKEQIVKLLNCGADIHFITE